MEEIFAAAIGNDGENLNNYGPILVMMIRDRAEAIEKDKVEKLIVLNSKFDKIEGNVLFLIEALCAIAECEPELFDKHRSKMLDDIVQEEKLNVYRVFHQYLIASSLSNGEQEADRSVKTLLEIIERPKTFSKDLLNSVFYTLQIIASQFKNIFAKRRSALLPFQSNEICQNLIHFIDGEKINEQNQTAINRTLEEIGFIDKRITETEVNVRNVTKSVGEQKNQVGIKFFPVFIRFVL